jgi:thymidine kinase
VDIVKGNMGWIEVVVGPMFSGKSEELIRRLRRAEIGKQRVQIFKPLIDQRYAKNGIVSHSGLEIASELVQTGSDILDKVQARTEVVGVDEAQFLGESVVESCVKLADLGKRVIVAGLDTDFMGRPFEPIPRLLAVAEEITKLLAICMRCGNPAVHTQRLVASEELIVVGAGGMYEARCRRCFEPQLAHERIQQEAETKQDKHKQNSADASRARAATH